ncbi:lipoprotein-releasing ABC transporter permease subunit [Thermodesulfobacteriota bacterium]
MQIPYELMIGLRYLSSRRKKSFVSLISIISILGVSIGVMALIIVLSVMTGFESDLKEKILGTNSHIVVLQYGGLMAEYDDVIKQVETFDGVKGATPFIYSQVMISSESSVSGVVIRGVEPKSAENVISLKNYMVKGSLSNLDDEVETDGDLLPGVIIGNELADLLGVGNLDTVNIVSPTGNLTPMGMSPKMEKYKVVGLFKSGMYEYDTTLAYVSIKNAKRFLSFGDDVTGVEIGLENIYESEKIAMEIQEELGFPYFTRDWKEMNSNLFSALKLEKIVMFIILVLIILVAAFNIISTLIMVVMEKGKEVAILKSIGASPSSIMKIFVSEGLIVGILGTLLGLAGGVASCFLLMKYEFIKLPKDVYYFSTLPVKMVWVDILVICVVSIVITFFATIYPSIRASKLSPVDALRYE